MKRIGRAMTSLNRREIGRDASLPYADCVFDCARVLANMAVSTTWVVRHSKKSIIKKRPTPWPLDTCRQKRQRTTRLHDVPWQQLLFELNGNVDLVQGLIAGDTECVAKSIKLRWTSVQDRILQVVFHGRMIRRHSFGKTNSVTRTYTSLGIRATRN